MVLSVCGEDVMKGSPVHITVVVILILLSFICIFIIWRQPQSKEVLTFKVMAMLFYYIQMVCCSGGIL